LDALRLLQRHGVAEQGADLLVSLESDLQEHLQQINQQATNPQADQGVVQQQLEELAALQRQVEALKEEMHNATTPPTPQDPRVVDDQRPDQPFVATAAPAVNGAPPPGVSTEPAAQPPATTEDAAANP
jgi:hypothetical protein